MLLGGADHVLTVDEATRLRDELTRELGAPALTDREAMVWAFEWLGAMSGGYSPLAAAGLAAVAVNTLRDLAQDAAATDGSTGTMLAAMTGGGR